MPEKWVSRIVASKYDMGTVYVTQTGRNTFAMSLRTGPVEIATTCCAGLAMTCGVKKATSHSAKPLFVLALKPSVNQSENTKICLDEERGSLRSILCPLGTPKRSEVSQEPHSFSHFLGLKYTISRIDPARSAASLKTASTGIPISTSSGARPFNRWTMPPSPSFTKATTSGVSR